MRQIRPMRGSQFQLFQSLMYNQVYPEMEIFAKASLTRDYGVAKLNEDILKMLYYLPEV